LARLSYTKINWRKQRFQKCMLEFVLLFGTEWPFLGYWPMDYIFHVDVNAAVISKPCTLEDLPLQSCHEVLLEHS